MSDRDRRECFLLKPRERHGVRPIVPEHHERRTNTDEVASVTNSSQPQGPSHCPGYHGNECVPHWNQLSGTNAAGAHCFVSSAASPRSTRSNVSSIIANPPCRLLASGAKARTPLAPLQIFYSRTCSLFAATSSAASASVTTTAAAIARAAAITGRIRRRVDEGVRRSPDANA